jgi:xylulose-5-phosphate/fructose-6-phosphate phosphoketolase
MKYLNAEGHGMKKTEYGLSDLATKALAYWRANCSLVASHLFGLSWPPPGQPQRRHLVGHWGANPGIAWIVGHLAACWKGQKPILTVLGTGHATSFLLAHKAIQDGWKSDVITSLNGRYGQPGGDPSELIGFPPGIPFLSGELGPALGVSQGIAIGLQERLVACIIGDGECESPATLAALAHRDVLLKDKVAWLPIINANGAKMGAQARFNVSSLDAMLRGFGYEVVVSTSTNSESVIEIAQMAIERATNGQPIAWISVTDKGWPAPSLLGGKTFRGASAHKPPRDLSEQNKVIFAEINKMVEAFSKGLLEDDGRVLDSISNLAQKVTFSLPMLSSTHSSGNLLQIKSNSNLQEDTWRSSMEEIDNFLADSSESVFCPDEGQSNRLFKTKECGLLIEVLAEELCSAWTIGCVEAGQISAMVTYEAFAPLLASQIAQYAKLVNARSSRGLRPLLIIQTSLGWGNSPTHQNTDLAATFICRPLPSLRLICPFSASSARMRLEDIIQNRRDEIVLVNCSKQPLLDIPDPGGSIVEVELEERSATSNQATIIAIGDVCVTEAVAAMQLGAEEGWCIRVLAVVDVTALDSDRHKSPKPQISDAPLVAVAWCAPRLIEGLLWQLVDRVFPVVGYRERFGVTPWETLVANKMDRFSLLATLGLGGNRQFDKGPLGWESGSVPHFNAPKLKVRCLEGEDSP